MRAAILGFCVWSIAAVCSAASPFDGKWTGEMVAAGAGGTQAITITISTDAGGKVTGSMTVQGTPGDVPISWGFVKDDLITFKTPMPGRAGGGAAITFVYLAKLNGDQIDLARRPEDLAVGALRKGTAKRAP